MHVWRAVHISAGCTVGVWEEGGRGAGLAGGLWFVGKHPGLPEQRTRKGVTRQPAPSCRPGLHTALLMCMALVLMVGHWWDADRCCHGGLG